MESVGYALFICLAAYGAYSATINALNFFFGRENKSTLPPGYELRITDPGYGDGAYTKLTLFYKGGAIYEGDYTSLGSFSRNVKKAVKVAWVHHAYKIDGGPQDGIN